jgi:hypothetical protein
VVRVVTSPRALRADLRRFAAVASQARGWGYQDAQEAVEGGAAVLVEALAAGSRSVLSPLAASVASGANDASVPVWGVAGVGCVRHGQLFGEIL